MIAFSPVDLRHNGISGILKSCSAISITPLIALNLYFFCRAPLTIKASLTNDARTKKKPAVLGIRRTAGHTWHIRYGMLY